MEYVQSSIATLHELDDPRPSAPIERASVVVPMTEREYAGLAADRVLTTLEDLNPARVIVPLRAPPTRVTSFRQWLATYDLTLEVLWCDGPRVSKLLEGAGLEGRSGKGRDVWLALGRAAEEEFVVVHDADTVSYDSSFLTRLLFPLAHGFKFTKGYYARVEDRQLYGRLFRLFYVPLIRALRTAHPTSYLRYLDSFRYALAGEFAATAEMVTQIRAPRSWGLEVGTLADAFDAAGFAHTAQVDLGRYEHDHRAVSGPTGLSEMSRSVGETLFRTIAQHDISIDFETLPHRYRNTAKQLLDQYAIDATFNGFEYPRSREREQIETYTKSIQPPGSPDYLPAWSDVDITPSAVVDAAVADADAVNTELTEDDTDSSIE
ncbi:glycosyltransferase family protein [Haloquadratum walsbyi]|uniref:Probable glycosyltransferase, type 2 n=1 Tax=Haloquadratum walsbyi (strain DSM 16854 / JCM 12705 / C23) TaxID=768065 RepID=G0LGG6_HALWC|nr:glycosyl transferase family 2 [Haloquadratum walsbyi]CCC39186.1 probable glycosyltransferase, type 2 [Haloquadratum walsbyi C23]